MQTANRCMKRCSISLLSRKCKSKTWWDTTSPVRSAMIKKNTNNKSWQACGEKGTLVHCWWKCTLEQPLCKTIRSFLIKLKIELSYNSEIPFLSIYLKKKTNSKRYMHLNVHSSVIYKCQAMKATLVSINRWLDKAIEKLNFAFCSNIDLEGIMLSEISLRQILYDITYI